MRSPESLSSMLPGGERKSCNEAAASNRMSFFRAARANAPENLRVQFATENPFSIPVAAILSFCRTMDNNPVNNVERAASTHESKLVGLPQMG